MNCHCSQRTAPAQAAIEGTEQEILEGRILAEGVAAAIERAGSRRVLVVSARHGDGRTHLCRTLEAMIGDRPTQGKTGWCFMGIEETAAHPAGEVCGDCRVIVDGPALLDGDGRLGLDQAWSDAIDGVIIVLRAGRTTEAELGALRHRLDALGLNPIGVIWNERREPGPLDVLSSLFSRVRGRGGRAPVAAPARSPVQATPFPIAQGPAAQGHRP